MSSSADVLYWFEAIGGFEVLLPFILAFTIMFAILEKTKILGGRKNFNVVIALVVALFLVSQQNLVTLLYEFLPRVSMIIIVILMILLVMGIFGVKSSVFTGWPFGLAVLISLVSVLGALSASVGYWPFPFSITSQDIGVLIAVGIFILVIWFIVREPRQGAGQQAGKFFENLARYLRGGR